MWGIEKEFFEFNGEMPFYFMIIGEIEKVEDIVEQLKIKAQKHKIFDGDIETLLIDTRYPYSSGSSSLFINSWENQDQLKSFDFRQVENDKLVSLEIVSDEYFKSITSYNFAPSTVKSDDTNILNGTASCNLGIGRYDESNLEIESWDISCELKIIQGEEKYPDKNLRVFKEDDPKAFVPKDISVKKYDFVYSKSYDITKELDSIDEKNEIWKERTQIYDDTNGKSILVEDPEKIVQINKMHVENNILYIDYSINPNKLLEDMPYLIEIKITATPKKCLCELDDWAENWTMQYECTENEGTEEDEAQEFLGCCTPDFIQSVEGLRGENM
ncbi:MAG: hypothetical protein AB1Z23_09670 [Eubacteriales bacterium]